MAVAGAAAISGTVAYFTDTETSKGNLFTAGTLDLKVDNTCHYNGMICTLGTAAPATWQLEPGVTIADPNLIGQPCECTWLTKSLTANDVFFNFGDVKPGDVGEDTVSLHVDTNPSWVCMNVNNVSDADNGCDSSPEFAAETTAYGAGNETCLTPGPNQGELQNYLLFTIWRDNGAGAEACNNILDGGHCIPLSLPGDGDDVKECAAITNQSACNSFTDDEFDNTECTWTSNGGEQVLAQDVKWVPGQDNVFAIADSTNGGTPFPGGTDSCIGISWRVPGSAGNIIQSDSVQADVNFTATQSRSNPNFVCAPSTAPIVTTGALLAAYVAPTVCDATVDDSFVAPIAPNFSTIQAAINDIGTTTGKTVCVKAGTYTEDVNVNKSITLAGDGPTLVTLTGVGLGEPGALVVSADNVTVKGFKVVGTGVAAMRISGAHTGDTFTSNDVVAATGKNAFLTDGGQSNHTISNNVFEGNGSQLVYVNGNASVTTPSTNVDFTSNTFGGTATGPLLGMEANGSSISLNKFTGTTGYTSIENWEGNNLVNQNNFDVLNQMDVTNSVNGNTQNVGTLNAENNWWGDITPADNVTGLVDFTPFATSAYAEN